MDPKTVAEIVFAAHDPGGVLMLGAAVEAARNKGHNIKLIGTGPAGMIWSNAGFAVTEVNTIYDLDSILDYCPDLIATGSGFGDFERSTWQWARLNACPAIALIDSWTSMERRFATSNGFEFPDAIGVIDTEARLQLHIETGCLKPVHIIGQAHLLEQTIRIEKIRRERYHKGGCKNLVFISEPIDSDYGRTERGFDQFQIFELFCNVSVDNGVSKLLLKPHPRECGARWQHYIENIKAQKGIDIVLCEDRADDLLSWVDGVVGMTSMVLLEAHLLGIPTMSIQVGRTKIVNPVIEFLDEPILESSEISKHFLTFMGKIGKIQNVQSRFSAIMYEADKRAVAAMETLIECDQD
ncbi:MAG: hypothetical protein CMF69_10235 [Magnetovibrio sp.]|nr:hypothetical protein [Magnetovibrio sp.]